MDIGIGLPNTLDAPGPLIVDWARRAEERGFSSLSTIDRIVYPNYDSLTVLAIAAGATSTIRLFPDILLTPLYQPMWLAKATASLDAASGGRLRLGLGVGARSDDFVAMDRTFDGRGQLMDDSLDVMHRAWAGEPVAGGEEPVCPPPANGNRVPILIGGHGPAAIRRMVRYGAGWTVGGASPDMAGPMVENVRQAWHAAGREGEPQLAALTYFGFGDEATSRASLLRYYGWLGDWAEAIAGSASRTPQAAKDLARQFADLGFTELIFDPTIASLDEVDKLADAVL